ncbi:sensor histidine kinase [Parahaliea mediterranea]|uniref:histidine kinase n=1 Tax=Parahaliea mediterranea TaxID=651086 RepID=A0A939DH46_9GAMM|nr:ATP-binding protein [Parahaliea mediterranea]MBN7798096.1 two-component sensor histidine kinase [Parahaliea mediterranea]
MKSIRASLVAMLVAAFTLVSFLAALLGYRASMDKAEDLLDSQLRYVAEILQAVDTTGAAARAAPDTEGLAFQVWREGSLVRYSAGLDEAPIVRLETGYGYANFAGFRWRTLARSDGAGTWYLVAERADLRYILAERVIMESILPLLTWIPVAAVVIWVLVGWGLRPLRALSEQINRKASDDLSPLSFPDPPTELAPVIRSTDALLARLSSALQRERDFASHAAHELRTPVSGMKVHLHNLSEELPAHPSLAHLRSDVARMQHLVEQILDLARSQPEQIGRSFVTVDLHHLAERVTASLWPDFTEAGVSLSLAGQACQVHGDEGLLETLLRNLLENACKYGGRGVEVEVFTTDSAQGPVLTVVDSGPGIPPHERERVFSRFYRAVDSDRKAVSGAGLGLAIVMQIAQLHGATVALGEREGGAGLSVEITFPRAGVQT